MTKLKAFSRRVRFNLRYLGRPPWDTGVSPPELIKFLDKTSPGRALDAGCGTGTNLLTMLEQGWGVVGVDLAWLSVLRARAKIKRQGYQAQIIPGDISSDLLPGMRFDLVLDIGCYHGLSCEQRADYRRNLLRWLRPGGTYLLYAHRRRSPDAAHGVDDADLQAFGAFLTPVWQVDNDEQRPDGGGGFPASWVRFDLADQTGQEHTT